MDLSIAADPPLVELEEFKQWILFEDNDLLVLNKPGWLVCHPSKNGPFSSLVGVAKEYLAVDTIHLASRLDRETSGVVLLAKHRKAASYWQKGIEHKSVRRCYLAILEGALTETQNISTYLGKDPYSEVYVKQMVTEKSRKAKFAETVFTPLFSANQYTLCSVSTRTGRKHQIRVHAQWMGHPLVGEKLYGSNEQIYLDFCTTGWREEWRDALGMTRQALHGRTLADSLSLQSFLAPLPEDFSCFLEQKLGLKNDLLQDSITKSDHSFLSSLAEN
jgi:23S rRNA pseudouridine1911/1915/1917 synthase